LLQYCLKGPLLMVQQAFQVPEHFNMYFLQPKTFLKSIFILTLSYTANAFS